MKITRFLKIKNYRIFRDFSWPRELLPFARYNLFYGWNGSGKSTLSSLFSKMQRKESQTEGEVTVEIDGSIGVLGSQFSTTHIPSVRVFNRHFIDDTLVAIKDASANGIITEEDAHKIENACDNEDKMRASIESAIKKRQEIDANLKEARLQFDNNILRLHDLRLQYEEVFRSLYDQKVSIEANERIQNSLRKIIVLLAEKEDADISELVSEMRCEILNAIRQASASRASDERSRLERLKVLDQQIMAQKKAGSELDNKCRRLENELSDSQREIARLNGTLEQYRKEHESLLQKKDSIKETEQTRKEIEALKVTIQLRKKEKEEAERMRNGSQCELKPLTDEMKRIFASVEGAFIPTFRGYARSFIGLDIDIDLQDVDGMTSLGINVNGYDRRSRFQLSESQQYFLDIALRFSLIEFSKSKNAFMLIDTPEGSLDIAYENRAGKMFADFVDKGYDVIMTANINSSQLLLKLAERYGKDKMKVERMTDWTMLTQVQQEEQEIIEKAYAQIENKLTMQND